MKFFYPLVVSCLALCVTAAPSTPYVVHEKRSFTRSHELIQHESKLDRRSIIPVSIALAQQNLENGHDFLMDVSDPTSPKYGKHWQPEKLTEMFCSTDETISSVKSWLVDNGISDDRITLSNGRNWLRMNMTIHEAEYLLKTEYRIFEHSQTAKRSLGCEEYSVPAVIQRHIDYITPTIESALTIKKLRLRDDDTAGRTYPNHLLMHKNATGAPPLVHAPPKSKDTLIRRDAGVNSLSWDLSVCNTYVSRACLQALYNIPNGTLSSSSMAVVEYNNQAFIEQDLADYLYNLVTATNPYDEPTIYVMSDTTFQTSTQNIDDDGEGNTDVQLALGLIYPQTLWYYQVGSDDVFFDAVDASYCAVDAASSNCGTTPLASVISVSWGTGEAPGDASQNRQCNEFMKFGLLGTTILFASGDSGVGSSCNTFQVGFPASCPYVTAVGATQIPSGGSVTSKEVAVSGFGSGGGFSNYWPLPSYQSSAVSTYYKNYAPSYTSAQYNNSQKVRAYPDLSSNGNDILIAFEGAWLQVGGTSCSAPTVGSIITLINEQRLKAGKSTVGFINPVIYANPSAFNDITSGSNPGCGTNGFSAVSGWDPVTGLGTPDYKKLLKVWLALA